MFTQTSLFKSPRKFVLLCVHEDWHEVSQKRHGQDDKHGDREFRLLFEAQIFSVFHLKQLLLLLHCEFYSDIAEVKQKRRVTLLFFQPERLKTT